MTVPDQDGGWWLASDGRWYPPETARPQAIPAPAQPQPVSYPPSMQSQVAGGLIPPDPYRPSWTAGPPPTPGGMPAPSGYPTTYPYPYLPGPGLPAPKTSPMAIWALVLVLLLGAIGALAGIPLAFVARSKIRQSGGALKGSGLALAALIVGFASVALVTLAIAIPTFIGVTSSGPSVQNLDNLVATQISGDGSTDFHASGVSNVSCQPPDQWTIGVTFTCTAYGRTGDQVGQYVGTVDPDTPDGTYQWNGRYYPTG